MSVSILPILGFRDLADGATLVQADSLTTFADLDRLLAERFPRLHTQVFKPDRTLRDSVLIFVNDSQVHRSDLATLSFDDGDRVLLVPSIVGG